jgi:hypothetical protein
MGVGPLRGMLTGATARPVLRLRVFSRTSSALSVLVVVAAAALAVGPAASRPGARVPSAVDCQRLLSRSPAPPGRPQQLPAQYAGKVLLYGRDVAPPRRRDGRVDCSPQDDPTGGLGATTNVQGRFAALLTPARDFVSVEASERVRNVTAERNALSETIGAVVGAP